jgi:adenosylmethionine-8-amino-7-oxononanoate aminotransferase
MGATLVAPHVEAGFRGGKDRAFYYGHTFCGHPLGAALAREVLRIYRDEKVLEHATRQGDSLDAAFTRLADHPRVLRTRRIGMAAAADLAPSSGANGGYLGGVGWRVYQEARKRGAYIRPLGDTVYLTPPLVIGDRDLADLLAIFEESVRVVLED